MNHSITETAIKAWNTSELSQFGPYNTELLGRAYLIPQNEFNEETHWEERSVIGATHGAYELVIEVVDPSNPLEAVKNEWEINLQAL